MKTTVIIARKELLDHLLSARFYLCLAAMVVLIGVSVFVMYRDYALRMDNYAVLRERARPRAGETDVMAVVRPRPLSVLAKGLDEALDRGYEVGAYLGIRPHSRQVQADSLFSLFAPPDLLYIVKVLLSLVALLLAYDAVAGERERGTLKLILSDSVPRGDLVSGKLIGGLAAVMVPFVLVVLAALIVISTRPDVALTGDDLLRAGLMVLASLLYATLFFALGVLISVLARTPARALVVSLFAWAVIVFALPNVGNLVAEQLVQVPSATAQEAARMQAFAKNRFLWIQSKGRNPEGSVGAFNGEYDRLLEQYRARVGQLTSTSKAICRVTPAAALSYIFTDLAGTGLGEYQRLSGALLEFKNRNLKALDRLVFRDADGKGQPLDTFDFPPPRIGSVLAGGVLADFSVLGIMTALLVVASAFAMLRVDPR